MRQFLTDALLLGNCFMVLHAISVSIFTSAKNDRRARPDRETQAALDRISAVGEHAQALMLRHAVQQLAARRNADSAQPPRPR
jgi:hypothetical protein